MSVLGNPVNPWRAPMCLKNIPLNWKQEIAWGKRGEHNQSMRFWSGEMESWASTVSLASIPINIDGSYLQGLDFIPHFVLVYTEQQPAMTFSPSWLQSPAGESFKLSAVKGCEHHTNNSRNAGKSLSTTDLVCGTKMALPFQFMLITGISGCTATANTTE